MSNPERSLVQLELVYTLTGKKSVRLIVNVELHAANLWKLNGVITHLI